MSWRAGAKLFWDFWPKIKEAIPEANFRGEFTRAQLRAFLDQDVDPLDLCNVDPEIDKLMDEIESDG